MNYNKQSSLEWLVEQIEKSSKEGDIDFLLWNLKQNLLEQAKAMREKEIKDAYDQADTDAYWEFHHNEPRTFANKHDYYNKKFGGNK